MLAAMHLWAAPRRVCGEDQPREVVRVQARAVDSEQASRSEVGESFAEHDEDASGPRS